MGVTKTERAAIRAALAAFIANDHDEEEFDGFDIADAANALDKMQEPTPRPPHGATIP